MTKKKIKEPKVPKPPKEKKPKKGYFDNNDMLELMIERNKIREDIENGTTPELEKALDVVENKISKLYIEVAKGMLRRPNFMNYPEDQKEEMVSDALYCMYRAGAKYDVKYPNPFGYLSQITWHAFIQSIKNMKKRTGVFVAIEHIENLNEFGDGGE